MPQKLAANLDNRTFYFTLVESKPTEVIIDMYNSIYTLVLKDEIWQNHTTNKMTMSAGLIGAVIQTLVK